MSAVWFNKNIYSILTLKYSQMFSTKRHIRTCPIVCNIPHVVLIVYPWSINCLIVYCSQYQLFDCLLLIISIIWLFTGDSINIFRLRANSELLRLFQQTINAVEHNKICEAQNILNTNDTLARFLFEGWHSNGQIVLEAYTGHLNTGIIICWNGFFSKK